MWACQPFVIIHGSVLWFGVSVRNLNRQPGKLGRDSESEFLPGVTLPVRVGRTHFQNLVRKTVLRSHHEYVGLVKPLRMGTLNDHLLSQFFLAVSRPTVRLGSALQFAFQFLSMTLHQIHQQRRYRRPTPALQ